MRSTRTAKVYVWLAGVVVLLILTTLVHYQYGTIRREGADLLVILSVGWLMAICGLLFAVFRSDLEATASIDLNEYAALSATAARLVRSTVHLLVGPASHQEKMDAFRDSVRQELNLAHEAFSFLARQRCTASIMIIRDETAKTVLYDDFVPSQRALGSAPIPLDQGILRIITSRNLAAMTIDNYSDVAAYPTPTIANGICLSGICVPLKVNSSVIGFFNVDSPAIGTFRSREHEKAAVTFAELIGTVLEIGRFHGLSAAEIKWDHYY